MRENDFKTLVAAGNRVLSAALAKALSEERRGHSARCNSGRATHPSGTVQEGIEKWLRFPDQSRECERLRNREMQRLRRREQVPRRSPERKSEHRLQRVKARPGARGPPKSWE